MFATMQFAKCMAILQSGRQPLESASQQAHSIGTIIAIAVAALSIGGPLPTLAQSGAPLSKDLRLVGSHPLQARSAYQVHPHRYPDGRYILFIGHHSGEMPDPQTGEVVENGTSIVDVTDPTNPVYLKHVPGVEGAQMAQACNGADLPGGNPEMVYLLRSNGNLEHQIWDVTDPANPVLLSTPQTGLDATHRNWWQCDTGIAYLVSDLRPFGWSTYRGLQVFDLSDPARPVLIRNFALPGMQPGGQGDYYGPNGIHEATVSEDGSKIYLAFGTGAKGVIQILDNRKLLNGDPSLEDPYAETFSNLLYPQLGRLDMPVHWGAHTVFSLGRIPVHYDRHFEIGASRDIIVVASESLANECREAHHGVSILDFTDGAHPYPIATYRLRDMSINFCERGGRFGTHNVNSTYHEPFYPGFIVVAYFNAGVRVVDVRDPFHPTEIAYYIPAVTKNTAPRCVTVDSNERCQTTIQTNIVEVDDRGLIYLSDRANTGVHIVELTGAAEALVEGGSATGRLAPE